MFDTQSEIHFTKPVFGHEGVAVRWPSDEEWAERSRLRKILVKRSGRGISETTVEPNAAYDLKMYEAVKLNGSPTLGAGAARAVVDALSTCDIMNVELSADEAVVTLRVVGGEVQHTLGQPSAEQVLDFRKKASRSRDLPYNTADLRILLEPGAKLWDACQGKSDDYPSGVPALHKDAAIRGVIDAIDRDLQAGIDDADFS